MTRLGKLLVLLNLALAIVLATWSFNIYTNGVDWTDRKDTKTTPPRMGQFAIRKEKLDELWKGVSPAQSDWLRERAQLKKEEDRLAAERVWYDGAIRYVLFGPTKGKNIHEVALADQDDPRTGVKKGQVLLDKDGYYPQLVPIRDPNNVPMQLQSLAEYNKLDEDILKEIAELIAQHQKQIEEANALTDKIIGDKAKGVRGLQQRINDEQAKNAEVIAEMKLIEPQFLNTLVEAQLVNKRHEQMIRRIEELKKINVASK
jgi:hypothetical protein